MYLRTNSYFRENNAAGEDAPRVQYVTAKRLTELCVHSLFFQIPDSGRSRAKKPNERPGVVWFHEGIPPNQHVYAVEHDMKCQGKLIETISAILYRVLARS